jgi:probable HAF family extracellular repeat protein
MVAQAPIREVGTMRSAAFLSATLLGLAACEPESTAPGPAAEPSAAVAAATATYTAIDLGTLGGAVSEAAAVNNSGQVVGSSFTSGDSLVRAFIWQNGVMKDLGALSPNGMSSASDINAAGQVVGESVTRSGELHGFLWQNGVMRDLGTLGGTFSRANGINGHGHVVGLSTTAGGGTRGFIWKNGVMRRIDALKSHSRAFAINNAGTIVGDYKLWPQRAHAFQVKDGILTDLGTLGGPQSLALAVNNAGTVAGWAQISTSTITHTFLYKDGVKTDLGLIGFGGLGPLDQVGGTRKASDGTNHVILWKSGVIIDLGRGAGGAMNGNEWIVGTRDIGGNSRATLWKPN